MKVAELIGEGREQRHQLLRLRFEGAGVELGDGEHVLRRADRDRDRQRRLQAQLGGDVEARSRGRVLAVVGRQGDLAALPRRRRAGRCPA